MKEKKEADARVRDMERQGENARGMESKDRRLMDRFYEQQRKKRKQRCCKKYEGKAGGMCTSLREMPKSSRERKDG